MRHHLKWCLYPTDDDGWEGHIYLSGESDAGPRTAVAIAKGMTRKEALHDAALMAQRIASNPWMQAVLPPGTVPILKGVRALARMGMSPEGKAALRSIRDNAPKAVARLVHFLHF